MDYGICFFCGMPITRLNGKGKDSLCMHHILYKPEFKVPAHKSCHSYYHVFTRSGYDFVDIFRIIRDRRNRSSILPEPERFEMTEEQSIGFYLWACKQAMNR